MKAVLTDREFKTKAQHRSVRKQIRGSSLLMIGRFLSVGLNFASQVILVRYLTQANYGAWTYALSLVAFFRPISSLGLRHSISRFVPIYHEQEKFAKLFGTIALTLGTILVVGGSIIAIMYASPETLSHMIKGDGQPVTLILIMIFLVPLEAMDAMLIALFASFSSPKAIFFRKYVVAPGFKLLVVLSMLMLHASVVFLAIGYVLATLLGILFYGILMVRLLAQEGLLEKMHGSRISLPVKEIVTFSIPLLTSDLVAILMHSTDTLILGYYHSTVQVAQYRVILPAAHFNKMAMDSFALLYMPLTARLFAQANNKGINELYWKTAIWISIISFPIFLVTFSIAKPLTVTLYGQAYQASWVFLTLLAFAYYFNASLGFNGLTLKVVGKLRYIVGLNIFVAILNVIGNFIFIPRYGAMGAAMTTAGSMIVHNILKQFGLRLISGVKMFDKTFLGYYVLLYGLAFMVLLIQLFFDLNIIASLIIVSVVSALVFHQSKHHLNMEENFPELMKLPLLKQLFGSRKS
ncbi:oligosaccharide flippase family protein [candidate division KSB1 bacterium]|nr:oligosaccharide flippase family protein [candidate division KSB1 bacterium]